MGMGLALMERLQADRGHIVNADWSTYLIPTAVDVPVINTEFIEVPEPDIAYGIKGMAELPHVQSPPAVLSALRAATGRALPVIPATAEMICGVADSEQSMTMVDAGRDERRGPWKVPVRQPVEGPWVKRS